jgi:hypothetical protein
MTPDFTLEELAKTRNWIVFGKALSAALDAPTCHGFDDASQMLAHVAQLRGVDPSSLRNPLSAVNWMKQNAAEALLEENPKLAMTGVLTLSQISILSSDLAENLIPKFFRGEVSRRQLQVALRNAEAKQGGRGVAANERVKRAIEFEEEVFRFLASNLESLELGDDVEIVRSGRDALVPSDFTVMRDGEAVAAIECKSHRNKKHRRYLLETLGMAALLTKDHRTAILIVPDSWGATTEELAKLVEQLHLSSVRIAVFAQDGESEERFKFLIG